MSVTVSFSQGNARQSGSFRKWMLCTTRRVASHAHSSVCHQLRLLLSASLAEDEHEEKTAAVKWGRGGERKKVIWGWSWQVHGQLQPDAGQWGGTPPPKPRAVLHPSACIVSSISASEHPHHRHSFSSLSSLLKTLGRRPCCDTVINTLYFYFPPSFLHRHRSNMIRWHKKKPASSNCRRRHDPVTFDSQPPPPPFDPSSPKPCLSSIYCPLSQSPHPQPPLVSSHHTRSVPVCVSCLSVTPCLQLHAQSEILQQESAATALSLSVSHSLSLTPSIQPLLVNTFFPVLINFFSFPVARTHTLRWTG